ncbi:adenylate kinase isoenzyme 1 [Eurytemora carolleeae]|uniref:adenylate kinase isoenzyme 1 n=1 Tax=Eurytemora carolleeae TaxID=1294199 RepID=UPI000C783521|nr:adenylate kinase isoenzyme 1 [Eurytemora carolleeae]|eukprot:XP_023331367.1 adenylate kinase isoenzyme 1-like [Eurytemora affinis]
MAEKSALAAANLPIIWILGGPGCGKGTQCEQIVSKYNYSHLSTGELLRSEVMSGSSRGIQLFSLMEKGQHVPDEEVVGLLAEAMMTRLNKTKGFLIDGFPAGLEQAKMFEDRIGSPTKILVFEANEEVLKCRLKERGNFDDKEESILKRIQLFTEKTKPVIDAYSKSLTKINSERSVGDIFADVCKNLES